MTYDPARRHRRSIRLRGYDYSQTGAYFVTVCTHHRGCLFGDVVNGEMRLNDAGRIIADTWSALPARFPTLDMDEFVVMPNHFHGIIIVGAGLAQPNESPNTLNGRAASSAPTAPTLGGKIRAFKSISAINVNRLLGRVGQSVWQRNYYEHIIRAHESLDRIRQYILDNPARWEFDRENPAAIHPDLDDAWAS